jgi:anti-sigma-K factor RskA
MRMSAHEQYADDLALYALGALQGDERAAIEKHLDTCADCRRELDQLRGDMALMAMAAAGPKPPQRSKQRLMSAIAKEPRRSEASGRRGWWAAIPWVLASAAAIMVVLLLRQNNGLQQRVAALASQSFAQQAELQKAREVVATLTASDAMRVTLVAAKTPPQPQGKAIYVRDRSSLIFLANNLPPLPPQKAYELWLIPKQGAPIPAGVFQPDARGSATVVNPPLPAGVEAKAFAITVEPEDGSSTPTMPIVMIGAGE